MICWAVPLLLMWAARALEASLLAERASQAKSIARRSTYVVIGASTGIGLELVKQLVARGSKVYATVRRSNKELSALTDCVIEGIDVTSDEACQQLASKLKGVAVDCLVCNAGSYDAGLTGATSPQDLFATQKLDAIASNTMQKVFDLNCVGPLRVIQALHKQVVRPGGKIAIISTQMGSIDDNTSGGSYAYRASKAAANMVGKGVAMDLKKEQISVACIAPGFVATAFGPGEAAMKKMGGRPVDVSVEGVVMALDAMSLDNTGTFVHANYGKGLKESKW